jgi:3-hydroxymyristoyl/3-hydroxydecanoyl-(acyl carrier protein) dehydratase
MTTMTKEEILKKASELISSKRQSTHGDCFKNHSQIADLWSVFLDDKLKTMKEITPGDVAVMMCLLKISRSTMGDFNLDDFVDGAAYMAIAGEMNNGSI